jgi:hypothetical protein
VALAAQRRPLVSEMAEDRCLTPGRDELCDRHDGQLVEYPLAAKALLLLLVAKPKNALVGEII